MTEYPKWQESIRAAQEDNRKQKAETAKKDSQREFAANSAKLTALGNFFNSLGLDTSYATTYREPNQVGFIFTNGPRSYKFYVWSSSTGDRLSISPVLTTAELELFDIANVDWWRYTNAHENGDNEVTEETKHEQEGNRYYHTVTGYSMRRNNTEEKLKVWIAGCLDAIDSGLVKATETAHNVLNKEGAEALAELATPKPLEWHELLFREVRVHVLDEVNRILEERNGEY